MSRGWKAPAGEAYVASEAPRGEISCYFVSDGGRYPYRMKMRGPSFYNIAVLEETARGLLIGMSLNTKRGHLMRALLEAPCLRTAEVVEAMS